MLMLAATSAEPVERALSLAQGVFGADCAAFYRIDAELQPYDYILRDVSPEFHRTYVEQMAGHDPLQVRAMLAQATTIGRVETNALIDRSEPYGAFLAAFGLSAALELLFRDGQVVHSGMCVMWRDAPPAEQEMLRLANSLQDYLAYTLRPKPERATQFGLTCREGDVAELLCCGRTNNEIATLLGIGVATVKTHLIHIYTKLGVETRAAAVGRLSTAVA